MYTIVDVTEKKDIETKDKSSEGASETEIDNKDTEEETTAFLFLLSIARATFEYLQHFASLMLCQETGI